MLRLFLLFVLLILLTNTPAFADQGEQVITLKDGSQIKGELSGIVNGVYTVKTPIIGDVHVNASDVDSITKAGNAAAPVVAVQNQAPGSMPSLDERIATSQQKLISDPKSMVILKEMMDDPEIMQALQDPALVQAVSSHDYQAVQSNPGVQKLINNPRMQALLKQLAAQQQQQKTSSQ